ncbi:MAG TPA: RHS repeat-associated core domain-containing protein [Armatimonadota bacterium]|nr:RHS repeat-associated core domain-containing protein [Armatimonadota bacterium]
MIANRGQATKFSTASGLPEGLFARRPKTTVACPRFPTQDRGIGNNSGSRILDLTFRDQADLDGYDRWGRITWMRNYKVSGGTDIAKFAYDYSYASDRKYQQDLVNTSPHQDEHYTYDTLHRLTSYKRGELNANKDGITGTPSREQTWVLDALGNWDNPSGLAIDSNDDGSAGTPSDARTHYSVNEIHTIDPEEAVGSFEVFHDDAGNLRILPDRTDPTNKADKYVYDYRNRLIHIWHTTQYNVSDPENSAWGDDPVVRYFYDGLNRRVKKDLNSGTDVIYLYDGWRCIEEREDDGGTWEARRQYVYGGTYIDEPLILDKDTDGDGVCTDAGGSSRFFYCQQANFNVVALAESDGDVVEKIKYDPYGEYAFIADGSTGNTLLFQGQRWNNESKLYCFKLRELSPQLGRFMQRDPAGYVNGMNTYQFAGGRPVDSLDPYGLVSARLQEIVEQIGLMGQQAQYINMPGCKGKAVRDALGNIGGAANMMIFEEFLKTLGKATWAIAKKMPGVGQYFTAAEIGYALANAWGGSNYSKAEFVSQAVSLTLDILLEHWDASWIQEQVKKQLEKAYDKAYDAAKARHIEVEVYKTTFGQSSCTTTVQATWDPTTNGYTWVAVDRKCTEDECGQNGPPVENGKGALYEYNLDVTARVSLAGKFLQTPAIKVYKATCCCK